MMDRCVKPVEELGDLLLGVEKPGRYVGGEAGILAGKHKNKESHLRTLIAFPDLYEIGMGNQALSIIYNRLNNMKDVSCDRAFAPAPDFEKLMREKNIPLYGLDTGISAACLDILMFTLGYELGLNGVLLMLDISQIPIRCNQRDGKHPIVIAGGPAVSNPLPYSPFIDAFWIGEAEAGFFELTAELAHLKKKGQGRAELLKKISSHPNVWVKGKEKARRAIYSDFSFDNTQAPVFPVPSMKIIQNHGTVEIMRGCPNGCRFCHAGFWYRPMRQKTKELIIAQVNDMAAKGGWQQISLSSLSSGDYCGIDELIQELNCRYSSAYVSFQLPSLRVSSFSLKLLEKISITRKSGITFAIETPQEASQMSLNKEVTRDSVTAILEEAKRRGWKGAKFYFMIGLPLPELIDEEKEIVDFVIDIAKKTRMHFNINVGIFIPKPHSPYQYAAQIDSAAAEKKLDFIRSKLKQLGHKVNVSNPLIAQIEGILSRGDEKAGLLCEEAYLGGSRLDAWDEYINKDKWKELLCKNSFIVNDFLSGKNSLSWAVIDSCVRSEYFKEELNKSDNSKLTAACEQKCSKCGVCRGKIKTIKNINNSVNQNNNKVNDAQLDIKSCNDHAIYRVLFSFCKKESAVFHGHLSLIEIFSMSFRRANIPVLYTKGFNPLMKIEFASPLATGISAEAEFAAVDFINKINTDLFVKNLNENLPQGIRINKAEIFLIPGGSKKHSLSSLLWGFAYKGIHNNIDYVKASEEKIYRKSRLETDCKTLFSFKRIEVLAKNHEAGSQEWISYFETYKSLYHITDTNCI